MHQTELFNIIFAIDGNLKQTLTQLQNEELFSYRLYKLNRLRAIAAQKPFDQGWRFITMKEWEPVLSEVEWAKFEYVEKSFFGDLSGTNLQEKVAFLDRAIYIGDPYPPQWGPDGASVQTLKQYAAMYQCCPNTLFLGWDWDNHFNLHISSVLAASSDFYFPTHLSNDYELSNFCNHKFRLPSSSYQWGRRFLTENLDLILRPDRSDTVFGRFMRYGLFRHRDQVITTLSQHLPGVQLVDDLSFYRSLDGRGKLEDWTRHKCHWVVPTLTDVSTRVFDALITGGIVIVPERFRGDPVFAGIDKRDCFFYNELDVIEPQRLARKALASFDRDGTDGVLRRHRHALDHHNLDTRVRTMIDMARSMLDENYHIEQE